MGSAEDVLRMYLRQDGLGALVHVHVHACVRACAQLCMRAHLCRTRVQVHACVEGQMDGDTLACAQT
jgi:hypothetical protein